MSATFLSSTLLAASDGGDPLMITLSLDAIVSAMVLVFLAGGCAGFVLGRRLYLEVGRDGARDAKGASISSTQPRSRGEGEGGDEEDEDGPTMVLRGSLDLMSSKWGDRRTKKGSAVVEYLSPEQMARLLFDREGGLSDTLCLDEYREYDSERVSSPRSSAVDIVSLLSPARNSASGHAKDKMTPASFVKLLSQIQRYSVDTSHPYFFNQLFGSLDPIALAAEIVALSVNTSVYTYETAPVFTLLEREVMGQIGKLVFGKRELKNVSDEGESVNGEREEEEEFQGEGLMIPGGSLANLTAMHAARHRWKVMNGYTTKQTNQVDSVDEDRYWSSPDGEEKKQEEIIISSEPNSSQQAANLYDYDRRNQPDLVAFVSSEAHYSFSKSARVLGLREDDLIVVPTLSDGRMDVKALSKKIEELELANQCSEADGAAEHAGDVSRRRVPFFVACTAGSTVRGSFDDVAEIVKVCRDYESRGLSSSGRECRSIWVHVDGAWGGSAIFSNRPSVRAATHTDEIRLADSFTFNPHKMLGAPQQTTAFIVRHRNALRDANAAGAKYLFDPRKNGAEYDLGDLSYTCGRRTDAVKLWALWKYHGRSGLGDRVDQKVDELQLFVEEMSKRGSFALACRPWPFNVNFFYFPPRIRVVLEDRGILKKPNSFGRDNETPWSSDDDYVQIPDDIAKDMANVSVKLKLRLHEAGEMIIPYQPLNNQKADCFRLVLAGKKDFGIKDICHVLDTMEKYGADL